MDDFSTVLENCLVAIGQGADLTICLSRYPEYAEQLKPQLELVLRMRIEAARLCQVDHSAPAGEIPFDVALSDAIQKVSQGIEPADCYALYPEHKDALGPWLDAVQDLLKNGGIGTIKNIGFPDITEQIPFPEALEASLKAIEQGETPDAVLLRYPYYADRLRPWVTYINELRIHYDFKFQPWDHVVVERKNVRIFNQAEKTRHGYLRTLLLSVLLTLLFFFGGTGLVNASGESLPGDALYAFKLTVETAQLLFTSDGTRTMLSAQYAAERRNEVDVLLQTGRIEDVVFEGEINIDAVHGHVLVGNIPTAFKDAQLLRKVFNGDLVRIYGRTTSEGFVLVHWMEIPASMK